MPVELAREGVNIMTEAAALAEKVAADQSALEAKAPLVADALIENRLVDPIDKAATEQLCIDPGAMQDMIVRLSKQAAQPRSMGTAKTAAGESDPQNPPEKESDRIFRETLGSPDNES
jgi:4-hydroxy-3-methylbut-2-en-1-yl diphosphate synthase IspG/GcpE